MGTAPAPAAPRWYELLGTVRAIRGEEGGRDPRGGRDREGGVTGSGLRGRGYGVGATGSVLRGVDSQVALSSSRVG